MGEFGQDAEVTPLLFSKEILGFLMTTESQDLGLTSHPKDGLCQYMIINTAVFVLSECKQMRKKMPMYSISRSACILF